MVTSGVHKSFKFPAGEMHVRILGPIGGQRINVTMDFKSSDDIVELILLCDAIKLNGGILNVLTMEYVPFSRQDKVHSPGDAFSLKTFCKIINKFGFEGVLTTDPHSRVTTNLINNSVSKTQTDLWISFFKEKNNFFLVCPDEGSVSKIEALRAYIRCPETIYFKKLRNKETGDITGIDAEIPDLKGMGCIIVDDICDGGRTFIGIAQKLKEHNPGKIILLVSHGFFTKGLSVFDGFIDEIYTKEGKVK